MSWRRAKLWKRSCGSSFERSSGGPSTLIGMLSKVDQPSVIDSLRLLPYGAVQWRSKARFKPIGLVLWQARDEGIHFAQHIRFVRLKDIVRCMRQSHDVRRREGGFESLGLRAGDL